MNKIKSVFKRIATWPVHPQWLVLRHRKKFLQQAASLVNNCVLDIGCAHQEIKQYLPKEKLYFGLDYPGTAIEMYGTKPNIFGDGQKLPFKDNVVDTILLMDVAEHLPNPGHCIDEIYRVLDGGGQLVLDVPFMYPVHDAPYDFQRWTSFGLSRLLEQSGFKIVREQQCGNTFSSGCLLICIGISEFILNRASKNPLWLALGLLAWPFILALNILGGATEVLAKSSTIAPYGYRIIACK